MESDMKLHNYASEEDREIERERGKEKRGDDAKRDGTV